MKRILSLLFLVLMIIPGCTAIKVNRTEPKETDNVVRIPEVPSITPTEVDSLSPIEMIEELIEDTGEEYPNDKKSEEEFIDQDSLNLEQFEKEVEESFAKMDEIERNLQDLEMFTIEMDENEMHEIDLLELELLYKDMQFR